MINWIYQYSVIITIFFIGIISFLFIILNPDEKGYATAFTIIGTVVSLFGLTLAIIQILQLKRAAVDTERATSLAIAQLRRSVSIAEYTKTAMLADQLLDNIRTRNNPHLLSDLDRLRSTLGSIKDVVLLDRMDKREDYVKLIINLGSNISAIESSNTNRSRVQYDNISANIRAISNILAEIESFLKHEEQNDG